MRQHSLFFVGPKTHIVAGAQMSNSDLQRTTGGGERGERVCLRYSISFLSLVIIKH